MADSNGVAQLVSRDLSDVAVVSKIAGRKRIE
jgi:hypothetical protein